MNGARPFPFPISDMIARIHSEIVGRSPPFVLSLSKHPLPSAKTEFIEGGARAT
jgi:hypothetical protein